MQRSDSRTDENRRQHSDTYVKLYPVRKHLLQDLGRNGRASWRLLNKQTCQDVYEETVSLTWVGNSSSAPLSTTTNTNAKRAASCTLAVASKCPNLLRLVTGRGVAPDSLAGLPASLRQLMLTGCQNISDFSPLAACTNLEVLTLSSDFQHNRPRLPGLGPIVQSLALNLRALRISWRSLDQPSDLAPALGALTGLKSLDIVGLKQTSITVAALAVNLGTLTSLCKLSLHACGIRGGVAAALVPAVAQLTRLTALDVGSNNVGPAGATALAVVLARMPSLCFLNASWNNYKACGMVELAPALGGCTALTELNLQGNDCGLEGVEALLPVIAALTKLKRLNLEHNLIGIRGEILLRRAMKDNPSLKISYSCWLD